jgi:acyl-CoA reductase-like NAD-dependent aldehyde dehydrogenase
MLDWLRRLMGRDRTNASRQIDKDDRVQALERAKRARELAAQLRQDQRRRILAMEADSMRRRR